MTADLIGQRFRVAHAPADDWRAAVDDVLAQLDGVDGAGAGPGAIGFLYASDLLADQLQKILDELIARTGIATWVGTLGIGVLAGRSAYYEKPGLAVMVGHLAPDAFELFDCVPPEPAAPSRDGLAPVALVHVDPRNQQVAELVSEIAKSSGAYLVGGLTSARGNRFDQIAGNLTDGGVSGVLFRPGVAVATGLTQGCTPIGPTRLITLGQDNVVMEIDGEPAVDVLREDLGVETDDQLRRSGGHILAGFPVEHADTGDYLVRNLVGVDLEKRWIAVAETIEPRQPILFCRRDQQAAETDLAAMARRVRARAPKARGAIYVSCLARGPHGFDSADAELAILQGGLGDLPLIGFFANGEISNDRLYGYTGVLLVF